jgi:hypothetical protein
MDILSVRSLTKVFHNLQLFTPWRRLPAIFRAAPRTIWPATVPNNVIHVGEKYI